MPMEQNTLSNLCLNQREENKMTIYQLKRKIDEWKKYKKDRATIYDRDLIRLKGLEEIADNEEYYLQLLKQAERAANNVIKNASASTSANK